MVFFKNRDINSVFRFVLVQNVRSMHDIELFTDLYDIGLSIICEYSAGDVRESSSWPTELVISFFTNLNYEH